MTKPDNPCLNCTERWVDESGTCHATCKRYALFQKLNQIFNDAMRKNKDSGHNGKKWIQSQTGWWRKK